jgi:hypothetical protein
VHRERIPNPKEGYGGGGRDWVPIDRYSCHSYPKVVLSDRPLVGGGKVEAGQMLELPQ